MNEDTFNLQVRKFLKKVGINAQRELEKSVRNAIANGKLSGTEKLDASMTLRVPALGLELVIEDTVALE